MKYTHSLRKNQISVPLSKEPGGYPPTPVNDSHPNSASESASDILVGAAGFIDPNHGDLT